MSNSSSNSGDIFDFRKIRRLVELMNEHGLSEIELCQGDKRIRLGRVTAPVGAAVAVQPSVAPAAALVSTDASDATSEPPASEKDTHVITSPMVGTFYVASSPDAPQYVKVGDHVEPDTTVCVVEAMKVFNEIPAGVSGAIVGVLSENGEPVEYGQPLFRVDTRK
jgi:acetyl-CoA carboxylase biotin carboxyl carrier protein